MPLTNNQKQEALRKRRAAAGLKRQEFWVTPDESEQLAEELRRIRRETMPEER